MSDRKKKYISYKEANKRPPVILSKHSEYNPDGDSNNKEGNRREKSSHSNDRDSAGQTSKQPTILIKARDDVQRSASPKRIQNKDNESGNTQKSSTATTTSDNTNPLSTTRMKNAVKLVDGNLEFNSQALDYLCDNQNDYLVVGVIGAQGVGKSTILNLIAHSNTSNLTERVLNSSNKFIERILNKDDNGIDSKSSSEVYSEHSDILSNSELASNSSDSNSHIVNEVLSKQISDVSLNKYTPENLRKDNNEFVKFEIESEEQLQIGKHCTNGIDMYITTNRIILLDTQPVLSASIMDKLMSSDNKIMPTDTQIELESLHVTSFILSICHVVLLVQDWFMDTNLLRFLHTADMLKPFNSAAVPLNEEAQTENYPHIMLVQNKATMSTFNDSSITYMSQVYANVFLESKMRVHSGLCADWHKFRDEIDKKFNHMDRINLFLLPEVLPDYDEHMYRGHDSLEQLVRILRQKILGATRTPIAHSVISEKHWGHFAAKTWDGIKKSSFFVEYTRMLS